MTTRPAYVKFSNHAKQRIRKRRMDFRLIESMMWAVPYDPGEHEWEPPGMGMRVVYADDMRVRTVVTAMWKHHQ